MKIVKEVKIVKEMKIAKEVKIVKEVKIFTEVKMVKEVKRSDSCGVSPVARLILIVQHAMAGLAFGTGTMAPMKFFFFKSSMHR